jgi:conjugative transfer signal peptidase TraF
MKRRALDLYCVCAAASLLAMLWFAGEVGLRINDTPSIPRGLYRTTNESVARGRHVLFCPASRPLFQRALERGYLSSGRCAAGSSYLMKRVWAVPGDRIAVLDDGVYINGARVPNSAPRAADGGGRPLPRYRIDDQVLDREQYLLLSETHPRSFDGRYFGPVTRSEIVAVIRPLFIWHNTSG